MKRNATTNDRWSLARIARLSRLKRSGSKTILVLLLMIFGFSSNMFSATYYWRGGSGDWSQASTHWSSVSSASPLPGEFYSTQPTSNDDVIFDNLSGPAGYTVQLNTGTAKAVRNITVTAPVNWSGTLNFLLFGDMDLSSPINFSGYSGQIWIYQQTTGISKNMNVGTTIFRTPIVFQPNFPANTIITGTYTSTSSMDIDLASTTDKVTFQTNMAYVGGGLIVRKGEVHFEQGFDTYLGNSSDFIVAPDGKLYTKQNSRTGTIYNAGTIDLNPLGSALTHNFGTVTGAYSSYTPTAVMLNIQNCTVNIGSVWSYGSSTSSIYTLQANSSTLNFRPTATEFQPKNYTFNTVNVDSLGASFRILFQSTNTITNPTFSTLNLMRDIDLNYSTSSLGILLRANIGSLILWPGRSYFYKTTVGGSFPNEAIGSCARFVVGTLSQMGTCERPISLYKMAFELGTPATVSSANIRTYDGIWALGGPYSSGTGSIMMSGGATNWTFPALPTPRTLIWVGATPAPANLANQNTYASWKNSANWRDAAELPVATGPGYTSGTPVCPPTYIDSVIFPNDSYVRVEDVSRAEARSINWQGSGRIYAANNVDLDIYGTLTFSSSMINDFGGTYHFKNDRPYQCRIKTSNKPFKAGVVFNGASLSNSWLIVDSLIVPNNDVDCGGGLNFSILLKNGVIHTGTANCGVGNSATIVGKLHAFAGGLNLYDSDVIVNGGLGSNPILKIEGVTLNAGTSNFICNSQTSQTLDFGANKKYYAITLSNNATPLVIGDPTHSLSFTSGDTVVSLKVNGNTKPWFRFLSSSAATVIRKMELNTTYRSIFMNSFAPIIDSLVSNVPVEMALQNSDVKVRSYLGLSPGSHVYSYFPAAPNKIILTAPTASYSNAAFNSCFSGTAAYPIGGVGDLNGTCTQQILLENIIIDNLSTAVVNGSYLNLVNTPITGMGGNYTNSNTSGNTSGWTGIASTSRTLRWKNTTAADNTSGNWNDPNNWEQVLPVPLPAPQCPPTRSDTVLFDNTSFSGTGQKVLLTNNQEIGSLYWRNIPAGQIPELVGGAGLTLSVFASLEFHQNMVNNFNGIVKFRGQPTGAFPQNHITSNTVHFKNSVYLFGDAATTEWVLTDNLYVNADLLFTQGRFFTTGKSVTASFMELFNSAPRYFNFENSVMSFNTSGFRVYSPANVTIVSTNSTINAAGLFVGGGKIYNDVNGVNTLTFDVSNGEEYRNIHLIAGNTTMGTSTSATGLKVKKIHKENNTFTFTINYSLIDSMLLHGPLLSESKILSSNKYFKDFEVKEGTTVTLGSGTVQWFQNQCDVDLIGTSTGTIQFFSTSSAPGNQAYLRKDSAVVCADFINMLNIWCVGNGNDAASSCSTYAHPSNPNVNTICASAHPYLISSCDTITDAFSACGPWEILQPLRGRASFTAGSTADNQLSSCRGWDFKPYPPVPSTVLASGTPSICAGQSVTLTITGVGKLPFDLDYSDSDGNVYYQTITNAAQLSSYNPTTFAFTYTTTVTPGSSITYYAGSIAIDRCFNNVSPPGIGSVAITVNQYPQVNNAVLASGVCSGNAATIVPSTTIPATVSWSSPVYSGVTGHGTSGSGTINESLINSNTSPVNLVYTLTPSANGCTGTPVDYTVTLNPLPGLVTSSSQLLDCNTSFVNVTASSSMPGVDFAWTGPSVLSGGNTNTATVGSVGAYNCVVTNPGTGCSNSGTTNVSFAPDLTNPTISCPSDITATTSSSTCVAGVTVPNPVINDNCVVAHLKWSMTGATVAASPTTGVNYIGTQDFNLGTTAVTYTVVDASNNESSCTFNVTVTDNVNPVITCSSDINAFTGSSSCTASIVTPNPVVSDNCTLSSLTWSIMQGATVIATGSGNIGTRVFDLGTSTVTYTATDAAGNIGTCSYTVTVTDNVNPVINCPSAINTFTGSSACTATIATPNPVVSDNCTLASLAWTVEQGATVLASGTGNLGTHVFSLGTSVVTYTATDAAGNFSICSYNVTVTDNVNPTLNCASPISVFTSSGSCTASVATPNPVVSDNCSLSSLTWTVTQGASVLASGTGNLGTFVFNPGISSVNYIATDAAGNSSTCSYTVTVTDNVNPTIMCSGDIAANTSDTTCDVSVNLPNVVFNDNCTVSSVSWIMTGATVGSSLTTGINQVGTQSFNSGQTTIFYTIVDAANNSSTCSFTVTVTDVTAPITPVLQDATGPCSILVSAPFTTDNCTGTIFGTTTDPLYYDSQVTDTIHWTFTDAAGNSTTAIQVVIVDNQLAPTAPLLPVLYGECSVTAPIPFATSGCFDSIAGTTSDPLFYDTQGIDTIHWTFDDGMGNVVIALQTVIVADTTDPVILAISNVSDECSVALTAPLAIDNCSDTIVGTTTSPTTYNSQGTFNIVWTFDDGNTNTSSVLQTVTIHDVTPPVLSACPTTINQNNDPGQCDAVVTWTPPIASDNCSGITLLSTHNPGDAFPIGTTTVTYTLTDIGGSTVSCSFDVNIAENEAPQLLNCPGDISQGNQAGQCGAAVSWTPPTAIDNCPGVVLTGTHDPGDFFDLGTTTVTYTATDATGNTVSCSFDVTVNDTENPLVMGCPADMTVSNTIGNCDGTASWVVPSVSDNCPGVILSSSHDPGDVFPAGTTTVTYTATDAAGNTVSCSFSVTVIDTEAPVIDGLSDLSVCEGAAANWSPVVSDNCPGVVFTSTNNPGEVFPLGTTTVTYVATDASGNADSVSFNVNVFALSDVSISMFPEELCLGDALTLEMINPSQVTSYEWILNGSVIGTNESLIIPSTSSENNGTYELIVGYPDGCVAHGILEINLDPCDILIPEALTPNGDGSNDKFAIENLENYPNSIIQIVNRWGAVVFESEDYQNNWDGTSYSKLNIGGDQLPEGTYYYVLKVGGDADTKLHGKVYTGFVYLKR